MIVFTTSGQIPSKKNSRSLFVRKGKLFNIPSNNYAKWHKDAIKQLSAQKRGLTFPIKNIYEIAIEITAHDRRRFDLTNKAESIMDLLVDVGIIEDDNYNIVPSIQITYAGVNKDQAGSIIIIKCLDQ